MAMTVLTSSQLQGKKLVIEKNKFGRTTGYEIKSNNKSQNNSPKQNFQQFGIDDTQNQQSRLLSPIESMALMNDYAPQSRVVENTFGQKGETVYVKDNKPQYKPIVPLTQTYINDEGKKKTVSLQTSSVINKANEIAIQEEKNYQRALQDPVYAKQYKEDRKNKTLKNIRNSEPAYGQFYDKQRDSRITPKVVANEFLAITSKGFEIAGSGAEGLVSDWRLDAESRYLKTNNSRSKFVYNNQANLLRFTENVFESGVTKVGTDKKTAITTGIFAGVGATIGGLKGLSGATTFFTETKTGVALAKSWKVAELTAGAGFLGYSGYQVATSEDKSATAGQISGELIRIASAFEGGKKVGTRIGEELAVPIIKAKPNYIPIETNVKGEEMFVLPETPTSGSKDIRLLGRMSEDPKVIGSLKEQVKLEGKTVTGVSASSGFFGTNPEVTISKPKVKPKERFLFADPRQGLRTNFLGLSSDAKSSYPTPSNLLQTKGQPTALIFRDTNVAEIPRSLSDVKFSLQKGKPLTSSQTQRFFEWQRTPEGKFKPVGYTNSKEWEIVLPETEVVAKQGKGYVTLIDKKPVRIYDVEVKGGAKTSDILMPEAKKTTQKEITLKELSSEIKLKPYYEAKPYGSFSISSYSTTTTNLLPYSSSGETSSFPRQSSPLSTLLSKSSSKSSSTSSSPSFMSLPKSSSPSRSSPSRSSPSRSQSRVLSSPSMSSSSSKSSSKKSDFFPFRLSSGRRSKSNKKTNTIESVFNPKYTSSIEAVVFDIKGTPTKQALRGLGVRPLLA